MKSVFITGGAGFIGKHICRRLLSSGYGLIVYDNFSNSSEKDFTNEFASFGQLAVIKGDITDRDLLTRSLINSTINSGAIAVVHLAAVVSIQESIRNPELTSRVNIGGSENVVAAMKASGISRAVFASSAAVYGALEPPLYEHLVDSDEISAARLLNPYAVSKLEGERIFLNPGLHAAVLRIFNVYGRGQSLAGGYPAVIASFLHSSKNNRKISVYGDGLQSRDFVSAGDVAIAVQLCLENPAAGGVFNVACGRETTLHDIIGIFEDIFSRKIDVEYLPTRPGDIKKSYADVSRISNVLGFSPSDNLYDGLRRLAFED